VWIIWSLQVVVALVARMVVVAALVDLELVLVQR
jgi:hypothetical protein